MSVLRHLHHQGRACGAAVARLFRIKVSTEGLHFDHGLVQFFAVI
jgi:hypothetical protein